MVAGDAANRGHLVRARRYADLALASPDLTTRAAALEVLADVGLYEGRHDEVRHLVQELREIGERLNDSHAVSIALVDGALAAIYGGRPLLARPDVGALEELEPRLAPSDAAWATYVRAELAPADEAVRLFARVVELGASVGNHLAVSVAQDSLGAALCRIGRLEEARAVLEECLLGFLRHAHYTQTDPAMRAVIGLLEALGDRASADALASELQRVTHAGASDAGGDRDEHRDLFVAAYEAVRRHRAV